MRICPTCKRSEPEASFYTEWKKPCSYCRDCWKAYSARYRKHHKETAQAINRKSWHKHTMRRAFERKLGGQTVYETLYAKQNGLCAICSQPETTGRYRTLSVDHCHSTEKVRGLLCNRCNRAIGLLGDDVSRLKTAIKYLESQ